MLRTLGQENFSGNLCWDVEWTAVYHTGCLNTWVSIWICLLHHVYVLVSQRVQLFATPWTASYQAPCPWDSPGQNTGVGCHFFSRGSSQPSDQTQVSRIAGRFFTYWATREVPWNNKGINKTLTKTWYSIFPEITRQRKMNLVLQYKRHYKVSIMSPGIILYTHGLSCCKAGEVSIRD